MPSERVQRRIDRLLDQAEEAADQRDWEAVLHFGREVLSLDSSNEDAPTLIRSAETMLGYSEPEHRTARSEMGSDGTQPKQDQPTSFASGRYTVRKFLGEGGKKKVYLAHDTTLDRDVAFALIKTEGLDETGRERIRREAQAMGRMGTHPCIMPIYDLGEESGQPFMVQPLMGGGDVEGLIEDADGPLPLERALEITEQVCRGLTFAHAKGIVHRDLKPGNVWLDEDGSAKIGDFGLAVAQDLSRLTVEKVMVGTVNYMPPEQATGAPVTPRADLYSLGAMLYEMVTGRPPFIGDDDIAVIGQHINTPPVSPTWHNPKLPRTLDSLIMRLLAKDPAERPESADEVLSAIEAIDVSAVEDVDEREGSLDSMAGGVFVGRQREMDQLKAAFEEALSGHGRMVTLVGEPGIGKTRTAQELATYAGMRGAQVLWGRSYESGGAPPYWPWVQAIRSHVSATEPDTLRRQMGSTAPVIAEIVPDVKETLPDPLQPAPQIDDPESARFRLFDSVSTFLKSASRAEPLVLMLEDLHWADKPSLMLLEFVARELSNSRLLVVGNYRDVELNRRHPLSVTLGELTRERLFDRVLLRGLQRHDVERFIEIAAGVQPPRALVDAVYTQTEGNPLFVTETVRLLIQEGDIAAGQTKRGGTTSWEIRIPEGVREVIGRRLDRLSERCNEVLTIAAVTGRQFRFPVLLKLTEDSSSESGQAMTENMLLDAMDEAVSARIVEELPDEVGLYQFTHAQMQETLVGELTANRKVRMHARIADALEEHYGSEANDHAEELVADFAEAETVLGANKLVEYATTAGEQALNAYAPAEAQAFFEQGLAAAPSGTDRARLLFGLGRAQISTLERRDLQRAADSLIEAFRLFESAGATEDALAVATHGFPNVHGPIGLADLLENALLHAPQGTLLRARLLAEFGQWTSVERGDYATAAKCLDEALSIAAREDASELTMRIHTIVASVHMWEMDGAAALTSALAAASMGDEHGALESQINGHFAAGVVYLTNGDLESARVHIEALIEPAERSGSRFHMTTVMVANGVIDAVSGDWRGAMKHLDTGLAASPNEPRLLSTACRVLFWTGQFEPGDELLDRLVFEAACEGASINTRSSAARAVSTGYLTTGRPLHLDACRALARGLLEQERLEKLTISNTLMALAELAIAEDDTAAAQEIVRSLNTEVGIGSPGRDKFVMGAVYHVAGEEDGVDRLESAVEFFRDAGFKPDLAESCEYLGRALVQRGRPHDSDRAVELQDEAITIARELGMKPLLERILAQREILKA